MPSRKIFRISIIWETSKDKQDIISKMLDVFYYSTDLPSPPQKRALTFWGRIGISSYFIKKSGELPSPHQLLKDQELEVKASHPVHGAMSV